MPGAKAYVGELLIDTSHKKKRSRDIVPAQKTKVNQRQKKESFVEHLIRLVNIFRVAAERFCLTGLTQAHYIGCLQKAKAINRSPSGCEVGQNSQSIRNSACERTIFMGSSHKSVKDAQT
ncbi:MAG TPA: hypothetical protein VEX17_03195 [Bacillales bacterium]|nr:hypothetical protein [Bacillales bacterium]